VKPGISENSRIINYLVTLVLLIPSWVVTLEFGIRPKSLNQVPSRTLVAFYGSSLNRVGEFGL
jgi:hypothetical protein